MSDIDDMVIYDQHGSRRWNQGWNSSLQDSVG